MPQYQQIDTSFDDLERLVAALADMGLDTVETYHHSQRLVSWRGQRHSPRAHVIVRARQLGPEHSDLGFYRKPDGKFQVVVSEDDMSDFGEEWIARLSSAYDTVVRSVAS